MEYLEDRRLLATAADDFYTVVQNQSLMVNAPGALSNDSYNDYFGPDGWDRPTATVDANPAHGTVVWSSGGGPGPDAGPPGLSFTYTPSPDYFGPDSFPYTVQDDDGASSATVHINVIGPPMAVDDHYSVHRNHVLTVDAPGALSNDSFNDNYGPNGTDHPTATIDSNPAHGNLTAWSGTGGSLSFTYVPAPGYVGEDSLSYTLQDNVGTSSATIYIDVTNDAPIATDDIIPGPQNWTSSITFGEWQLSANDYDPNWDALTTSVVTSPSHGTLVRNENGSSTTYTYTPEANYHGVDTFTYQSFDGLTYSDPATATIHVDHPPVFGGASYSTTEDQPLTISDVAAGIVGHSWDQDADGISAIWVYAYNGGEVNWNSDGTFTFTPPLHFSGTASLFAEVSDGLDTNGGNFTIDVVPYPQAPTTSDDTYETVAPTPLTMSASLGVLANDRDIYQHGMSARATSSPSHGSLAMNADGSFTYTPVATYSGADSFTYEAYNDVGATQATVSINVISPSDPHAVEHDGELFQTREVGTLNNLGYFVSGSQLWRTDGTDAGTYVVTAISGNYGVNFTNFDGTLYFFSLDPTLYQFQLWRTDGTASGTLLVKNLPLAWQARSMLSLNDTLFLRIGNTGWASDGTSTGTTEVLSASADVDTLVAIGDKAYFGTSGNYGRQLWASDGTADGTVMLSSQASQLTDLNGAAFFVAPGPMYGTAIYKSDGTIAGTTLVYYCSVNNGAGPLGVGPTALRVVNGMLFFMANGYSNTPAELWKSDGSPEGTVLLEDFSVTYYSQLILPCASVGSTFLFSVARDSTYDRELWRSDGTQEGTFRLTGSVFEGAQGVPADGIMYFQALSSPWQTDGTLDGTHPKTQEPQGLAYWTDQFHGAPLNGGILYTYYDWSVENTVLGYMGPGNHAPVGSDKSITASAVTPYTLSLADFPMTDPNDRLPNVLAGVKITTLPTAGTLTDNGTAVTAGQVIPVADISAGLLQYVPPQNCGPNNQVHFTFQVQDDGSTAGGANLDATARTFNLTLTAPEIAMSAFYSDGMSLEIDYTVSYQEPAPYKITVYASHDGTTLDEQLWQGNGGTQLGNYTVQFQPEYDDWYEDYRLIAVLDSEDDVAELGETNNSALFTGGAYIMHEPDFGTRVLHIDAGNTATSTSISKLNATTLRVTQSGHSQDYSTVPLDANAVDEVHYRGHTEGDTFTIDPLLDLPIWSLIRGPVAQDGSYEVDANSDTPLDVSAEDGVLSSASDDDGDPLTAVLVSGPSHAASFTLNSDGSFTYLPAANYAGSDSFTFRASDGSQHLSAPATVTINVTAPDGAFTGHNVDISLDFSFIADVQVDDRYGPPHDGYDGWLADERYVTVTLTGPDGFEDSAIRGVDQLTTGDVQFAIPDPFTDYTVTVTPNEGLKLAWQNPDSGYIVNGVPTTFTFNSSDPTVFNSQGDFSRDFVVLSTGINTAAEADDPVNNMPEGYHIPNAETPPVVADDIWGPTVAEKPYIVVAGGTLNIDTDGNGKPLDEGGNPVDDTQDPEDEGISTHGILLGDTLITDYPLDYPDEPANMLHPYYGWDMSDPDNPQQVLRVTSYTQPAHGEVTVNANGSFQFKATDTNFSGLTYFRIIVSAISGGVGQALQATIYMQVDQKPSARVQVVDFLGNLNLLSDPKVNVQTNPPTLSSISYNTSNEYYDENADGQIQRPFDHAYPVAYVRGSTIQLNGRLRTAEEVPLSEVGLIRVRATGDLGVIINPVVAIPSILDRRTIVFSGATSAAPLPNIVNYKKDFALNWEVSFDGGLTWESAGTSKESLYETLSAPKTDKLYETVVWLGSNFGTGATNATALFSSVWQYFASLQVQTVDRRSLVYWGNENAQITFETTADWLIAMGNGQCNSFVDLLANALLAQGIDSFVRHKISPIAPANGLLVKSWMFVTNGRNYNLGPWMYNTQADMRKNQGVPGQNNPNPRSYFSDHFVISYVGKIYDPSYGTVSTGTRDWEVRSLVGTMRVQTDMNGNFVTGFVKKKDENADETVFNPPFQP